MPTHSSLLWFRHQILAVMAVLLLTACGLTPDQAAQTAVTLRIAPQQVSRDQPLHGRDFPAGAVERVLAYLIREAHAEADRVLDVYPFLDRDVPVTLQIVAEGFTTRSINEDYNSGNPFEIIEVEDEEALLIATTEVTLNVPTSVDLTFIIKAFLPSPTGVPGERLRFYTSRVTLTREELSAPNPEVLAEMEVDVDTTKVPPNADDADCIVSGTGARADVDADGICDLYENLFRVRDNRPGSATFGQFIDDVDLDGTPNGGDEDADGDGLSDLDEGLVIPEDAENVRRYRGFPYFVYANPVARPDAYSVGEGATLTVDVENGVLANDHDRQGDPLTAERVSVPLRGSLVLNDDGSFTYIHDGSETTADSFSYRPLDGLDYGRTVSVDIEIVPVNDPPQGSVLIVGDAIEDTTLRADVSGLSDAEGLGPLAYQWYRGVSAIPGANGVTYTPGDADVGQAIRVVVSYVDGQGTPERVDSAPTLAVVNINDPPEAVDDAVETEDVTPVILDPRSNDGDVDGDALTIVAVTQPATGTVSFTTDSVTYTPESGMPGIYAFDYTVSDGALNSTATITVTVTDSQKPPQFTGTPAIANTTAYVGDRLVLADTQTVDANGDAVTLSYQWQRSADNTSYAPIAGAVSDTYVVVAADAHQYIRCRLTADDGNGGVTVVPTTALVVSNSGPTANDSVVQAWRNTTVDIAVLDNARDADLDALSLAAIPATSRQGGGLTENPDGTVTYAPLPGFTGADSFVYTVADGYGGTATATIFLEIILPEQEIRPIPDTSSVDPGDVITVSLEYMTTNGDAATTGLGLRIHYDSSLLQWTGLDGLLLDGLTGQDTQPVEDLDDLDANPATDRYVQVAWADRAGGWPGGNLPASLGRVSFMVSPTAVSGVTTSIRFSTSSNAAGYGVIAMPVTIEIN